LERLGVHFHTKSENEKKSKLFIKGTSNSTLGICKGDVSKTVGNVGCTHALQAAILDLVNFYSN
jgi:hypothetical protein